MAPATGVIPVESVIFPRITPVLAWAWAWRTVGRARNDATSSREGAERRSRRGRSMKQALSKVAERLRRCAKLVGSGDSLPRDLNGRKDRQNSAAEHRGGGASLGAKHPVSQQRPAAVSVGPEVPLTPSPTR